MTVWTSLLVSWFVLVTANELDNETGGDTSRKPLHKPNLVIIMMDDFGWGDPGYNGFSDHITPNMDRLAKEYLQLNNYYTQPVCTPGRSAMMTGKYPAKMGLQHETISVFQPRGTPLEHKFLSKRLQEEGYQTHGVGKWHLGFYKWDYTPLARGFDTFYGFLTGHETYFTHQNRNGYDFRLNTRSDNGSIVNENLWADKGTHCSTLYEDRIDEVIRDRDQEKPLFLYFAMTNPHIPVQPPTNVELKQRYTDAGLNYTNWKGLITNADDQIGSTIASLEKYGILDDTVIMIVSDNGGYAGKNGNLRGFKRSLYEGGIKSPAIVVHPKVKGRGIVDDLMHVTDIHTLYTRLGRCGFNERCNKMKDLAGLDSETSVYSMVFKGKKGRRSGFLINVDQINREAAIRQGHFKLRVSWKRQLSSEEKKERRRNRKRRNPYDLIPDGWQNNKKWSVFDKRRSVFKRDTESTHRAHPESAHRVKRSVLVEESDLPFEEKERQVNAIVEEETRDELMRHPLITNEDLIELLNNGKKFRAELYDLVNDPSESNNIAQDEENITAWLVKMLQQEISEGVMLPGQMRDVQDGNPKHWGGAWMPWA